MSVIWSILLALGIPIDFDRINTYAGLSKNFVAGIVIHLGLHGNKFNYILRSHTYNTTVFINKKMLLKSLYCGLNRLFPGTDILIIDTSCNKKCEDQDMYPEVNSTHFISVMNDVAQSLFKQQVEDRYLEFRNLIKDKQTTFMTALIMGDDHETLTQAFFKYCSNFYPAGVSISNELLPVDVKYGITLAMRMKACIYGALYWNPVVAMQPSTIKPEPYSVVAESEQSYLNGFCDIFAGFRTHVNNSIDLVHSFGKICDHCEGWQLQDHNMYISYNDSEGYGHFYTDKTNDSIYTMATAYLSNLNLLISQQHVCYILPQSVIFNLVYIMTKYESLSAKLISKKSSLYCASRLSYNDLQVLAKAWYIFNYKNYEIPRNIRLPDIIPTAVTEMLEEGRNWFFRVRMCAFDRQYINTEYILDAETKSSPYTYVDVEGNVTFILKG